MRIYSIAFFNDTCRRPRRETELTVTRDETHGRAVTCEQAEKPRNPK